jgi:hypothetical protein
MSTNNELVLASSKKATKKDSGIFIPDTCADYPIDDYMKSAQIPNKPMVIRDTIDINEFDVTRDETSDDMDNTIVNQNLQTKEQLQVDLTCPETQIPPDLTASFAQKANVAKEITTVIRKFKFKLPEKDKRKNLSII